MHLRQRLQDQGHGFRQIFLVGQDLRHICFCENQLCAIFSFVIHIFGKAISVLFHKMRMFPLIVCMCNALIMDKLGVEVFFFFLLGRKYKVQFLGGVCEPHIFTFYTFGLLDYNQNVL